MSTDPRPGHVLKTVSAFEILARLYVGATCAQTTLSKYAVRHAVRKEARISRSYLHTSSRRWCVYRHGYEHGRGCAASRGLSAFIGVYRAWLAADELLGSNRNAVEPMRCDARRRWRGKKHVPDSQNRGAVTRRCCGARRPIDHQSLPSRMRRSLPHDFGVPTPKRVPYIIYTISLRSV